MHVRKQCTARRTHLNAAKLMAFVLLGPYSLVAHRDTPLMGDPLCQRMGTAMVLALCACVAPALISPMRC